jgi:hypothetical protein
MSGNGGGLIIDTTINLPVVFGVVVWLVTIILAWSKFGGRIDIIELRVSHMEKTLETIAKTLELFQSNEKTLVAIQLQLATIQSAHTTLNTTVEDLRRGQGWITGPRRGNIDGEYKRDD